MKKPLILIAMVSVLLGFVGSAEASVNLIENGTFDDDFDNWIPFGPTAIVSGFPVFDGNFAVLGWGSDAGVAALGQLFNIPAGTPALNISFDYTFFGWDNLPEADDDALAFLIHLESTPPFLNVNGLLHLESPDDYLFITRPIPGTPLATDTFSTTIPLGNVLNIPTNALLGFVIVETPEDCGGGSCDPHVNPDVLSSNSDFAIDNVKVEPVPEPATIFLLGAGLLGLAGFRKKRS